MLGVEVQGTSVSSDALAVEGLPQRFEIDWSQPWYADVADAGRCAMTPCPGAAKDNELAQALTGELCVNLMPPAGDIDAGGWRAWLCAAAAARGLTTGAGLPLTFVSQTALPPDRAYEAFIAETGAVPTRHNLHDFFNGLIWLTFPRTKAVLNARQSMAIAEHGIGATRGMLRDAATLFDENAVLFVTTDDKLANALRSFDWQTLFVAHRSAWGRSVEVVGFGHALLEKLVNPYKAITAHAWVIAAEPAYFSLPRVERCAWLDKTLAARLDGAPLTSRDFAPLPVLGIPGWWPENEVPDFYTDTSVFRTGRRVTRHAC